MILAGLVGGPPILGVLLHNRLMTYLGRLSYSLYLVHLPVQFYIIFPLIGYKKGLMMLERSEVWWGVAASVVCMWLVAECTYRWVEKPSLRLKPLMTGADRQTGRPDDKR